MHTDPSSVFARGRSRRSAGSFVRYAAATALILLIAGCATVGGSPTGLPAVPDPGREEAASAVRAPDSAELSPRQRRVAESAAALVGKRVLRVEGKRFRFDCTGTILAAHYAAGVDVEEHFHRHSGNGVTRLYKIAHAEDLLAEGSATPQVGDILFWDNTYDRNGDGQWNDPLTHAGIVIRTYSDGRIDYVHHNYREGIVVAHMNLASPDVHVHGDTEVNSPMRMKGERHPRPAQWLSSHLFRARAGLYGL